MGRLRASVAFRLALGYGALIVICLLINALVFYLGTVGVLARSVDSTVLAEANRLTEHAATRNLDALRDEIQQLLDDGRDSDVEAYLLLAPDGRRLAGNLDQWPHFKSPFDEIADLPVMRQGRPSFSRLLPRRLPDGARLVVGRDLHDQDEIQHLVLRALALGAVMALLLAFIGATLFRRQLERRIAAIRHTALEITAGDLSRRIPLQKEDDEFDRLNGDINRMLDWIEQLMAGVKHVSNAIAHDLRTPLGRIRAQLEAGLRAGGESDHLAHSAQFAITRIDELITIFDKLLQIAEAESGARRQSFGPVLLAPIISDIAELYDATAEAKGSVIRLHGSPTASTYGDKDLLASAIGNLIDNALKYAGNGATIQIRTSFENGKTIVGVADNGPGIPPDERPKVVERFYRLDRSRSHPGSGLGLSLVQAITLLHQGRLELADAKPGLLARLILPGVEGVSLPNGNSLDREPTGDLAIIGAVNSG